MLFCSGIDTPRGLRDPRCRRARRRSCRSWQPQIPAFSAGDLIDRLATDPDRTKSIALQTARDLLLRPAMLQPIDDTVAQGGMAQKLALTPATIPGEILRCHREIAVIGFVLRVDPGVASQLSKDRRAMLNRDAGRRKSPKSTPA